MPKLKETPVQRMERVFRAAVFYGLERRAETIDDLAKRAPNARSTTYRRVRIPRTCTFEEGLFYIPKFLNDRQLCEMWGCGIPRYHTGGCGCGDRREGQKYLNLLSY